MEAGHIILLVFPMTVFDIVIIPLMRRLQKDMLYGKRQNRVKVIKAQNLWDRIILSYLYRHLKKHRRSFRIWNKIYQAYLISAIVTYALFAGACKFYPTFAIKCSFLLAGIKLLFLLYLRMTVFKKGFNTYSKFADKTCN